MKKPYFNSIERRFITTCDNADLSYDMKRKLVRLKRFRNFFRLFKLKIKT